MDTKKIKIADLHGAEKNVRKHPQKQLEELQRSFKMFGQYRPLVVTSDMEVLVGNGLFEAMSQTDQKTLECIVLPENTSDEYKKKLMLADNKIFDLGADAMSNIDDLLMSLNDFDIPGFDEGMLEQIYTDIQDEVEEIESTAVSGTIPQDRIEQIQHVAEERSQHEAVDDPDKYRVNEEVVSMRNEHDGEPYITCPHCGVKIYGYN